MTTAAPDATRSNPWILNPSADLILILLTPLLIVPIVAFAQNFWGAFQISVFVAAFGAMGHQLPGMIRAYGDRELFSDFRLRFILSPILLTVGCVYAVHQDLAVVHLVVLLWGFWHGFMQVYGFMRIYDVKIGSTSKWTARLDWLMVFMGFGVGLLYSQGQAASILDKFYISGGPLVPPAAMDALRTGWWIVTAVVFVVYVGHTIARFRAGNPPSPVKLALLVTGVGFYAYALAVMPIAILGIALFEIFHDSQYLTIVWAHNRKLVEKGAPLDAMSRFLFRPSGMLALLYVGLVFAYGAIGYVIPEAIAIDAIPKELYGLIYALALLHFYFDGFIWKVRRKSIRAGLGIEGGAPMAERGAFGLPMGASHGLKWIALLAPVVALGVLQVRATPIDVTERAANVAAAFPSARAHMEAAGQYQERGMPADAIRHYETVLELDPRRVIARTYLGELYAESDPERSLEQFRLALEQKPGSVPYRVALADQLARMGRLEEAIPEYERAIAARPAQQPSYRRYMDRQLRLARRRLAERPPGAPEASD